MFETTTTTEENTTVETTVTNNDWMNTAMIAENNAEIIVDLSPTPTPTILPMPTITISEVLGMLKRGYARTTTDKSYDANVGTIAEFYGMSDNEIKELFRHPKLKGKKTVKVKNEVSRFTIVDDTESEINENNN
jgi:hypothetical protein